MVEYIYTIAVTLKDILEELKRFNKNYEKVNRLGKYAPGE